MSKKMLIVTVVVLAVVQGSCTAGGYSGGSGADSHAGHAH